MLEALGRPGPRAPGTELVVSERALDRLAMSGRDGDAQPSLRVTYVLADAAGGMTLEAVYEPLSDSPSFFGRRVGGSGVPAQRLIDWAKDDIQRVGAAIGEAERALLANRPASAETSPAKLKVSVKAQIRSVPNRHRAL